LTADSNSNELKLQCTGKRRSLQMRSGSDAVDYASHLTEINEVQEVAGL